MRLITLALLAASVSPLQATEIVPWQDAGRHVGRIAVVEGFVREVVPARGHFTLLFDPDDPKAVRATVVIPLLTDLPPEPESLYRHRRVQVRGRISRTAGHLEVIVTDPDLITVAGLTDDGDPQPPPGPTESPRRSPAATPRPPAAPVSPDRCARLASSRDALRRDVLRAVDALKACVTDRRPHCAATADEIAAPLARLESTEQELRAHCAAGS